jgi:hypothetical protein
MAYRVTTSAQRVAMAGLMDVYRHGRVAFTGPDPDTGSVLAHITEPGLQLFKLVNRDGMISEKVPPHNIDPTIWARIAGDYAWPV